MGELPTDGIVQACAQYMASLERTIGSFSDFERGCKPLKESCHNSCDQAIQLAVAKERFCNQNRCHRGGGESPVELDQVAQSCNVHDEQLDQAIQAITSLKQNNQAMQQCQGIASDGMHNKALASTKSASAAIEGTNESGGSGKDKFDPYYDSLRPPGNHGFDSVESKATKTNYKPMGGGGGGFMGGGQGQAGYGGQSQQGQGNAGSGGSGGGDSGGVISGYGGGRAGGGGGFRGGVGGGYNSDSDDGSGRRAGATVAAGVAVNAARYKAGMSLKDFLPGGSGDPRARKMAAIQERDGITAANGPTIWSKVSNRYRLHEGSLLPP
jgi:hypothetical protein